MAHSAGGFIHTFAYSFHMPLFFIVSGYFFKQRSLQDELKKDFIRLIIPFFFTEVIILAGAYLLQDINNASIVSVSDAWEMLFYGNGGSSNYGKIWGNFASVGSVWFLPALFWAKLCFNIIYNNLTKKKLIVTSFFICVLAVIIGQYLVLPYYMIQGLTAVVFLAIGYIAHCYGISALYNKKWKIVVLTICIIGWISTSPFDIFDMYQMRWKFGILPNIILASTGTFVFYVLSKYILQYTKFISRFFIFLGRYSLVILCFAPIKYYLIPIESFIPFTGMVHSLLVIATKVLWIAVTIMMTCKINMLKKIFKV